LKDSNKILIGLVLTILVLAGFFVLRPERPVEIDRTKKVVAFGDSLVFGVGSQKGGGFVSVLSERLGVEIINKGISGNTTEDGLSRIDEIFALEPDVVVLLLGGNDALRRIPEAQTFANLKNIIIQLKAKNIQVLLLGVRGGLLGDSFKDNFKTLSKETGTPLVSDVLDGLFGDSRYMSDGIHPNDLGYGKIADRVEPELRKLLAK
jgi:lysophospholipase L1-like esterase